MNNCDIVRDLIPLCIDHVASEESEKLVNEHVESCIECKKVMEDMKNSLELPVSSTEQLKGAEPFYRLKKSLVKTIVKSVTIGVIVIALLIIATRQMFSLTFPVHSPEVRFYMEDDELLMEYNGPGDIIYSASGHWVDEAGDEPFDWTFEFYNSFWDKYIAPIYDDEPEVYIITDVYKVKRIYDIDGTLLWENPDVK